MKRIIKKKQADNKQKVHSYFHSQTHIHLFNHTYKPNSNMKTNILNSDKTHCLMCLQQASFTPLLTMSN